MNELVIIEEKIHELEEQLKKEKEQAQKLRQDFASSKRLRDIAERRRDMIVSLTEENRALRERAMRLEEGGMYGHSKERILLALKTLDAIEEVHGESGLTSIF